ncbi:MAG: leucine-rich repeat domain-containing protein [Prevotella sp.]|nr:leucine-rich repeat domain-containing protein [Prevotella sp.]
MKKLLIIWLMLLPMIANAYDFEKDGIYYNITSLQDLTVEVTSGDNRYEGMVIIPETVEYSERTFHVIRIGEKAFQGSYNLNNIIIPLSVETIGQYAFSGCSQLYELSIPSSVISIENGCFTGCSSLSILKIEDGDSFLSISFKEYQVNNYSSFRDCSLVYVYLGRNISSTYSSPDYHALFYNQRNLKTIEIGDKVTRIGDFVNCIGLENISIPNNVKMISANAFYGCANLKNINLQEGVQEISSSAFSGCKSLEKVLFPSSISFIGASAFEGCTNITKVYSKITEPFDIAESTFAGITYLNCVLYVPIGTKSLYQERTGWKDFASIVETDDFDNILNFYSANFTVSNGGTVICNGVSMANTKLSMIIKESDDISLQIIPNYSYRISSLIVDGNDVTKDIVDGVYIIKNVKSDVEIYASFERYFDVGNLTKVVDFIMNNSASTSDIALYDLNDNEKLDIGDVILIVKFILNNSNDAPNSISRRAGEVADLCQYTAAQFEIKTTSNTEIHLVKSMEQTHQMMYQQKDANTYAVVVYSLTNQLMQPENGKIIETDNNSDILSIENVTVATPTGETAYYQTLSATTGIEQIENENGTAVIYNLKGNRLNNEKALNKGIYIVNGKKTVVR